MNRLMGLTMLVALSSALQIGNCLAQNNSEQIEQQANQVYNSIMSPYCPGRLLTNCPSSAATELKQKIKDSLIAGASADSIIEDMVKTFGPEARAVPQNAGFGRLAWLVPVAFLAFGMLIIFFWLRANRAQISDQEE